jgi:hypothetical protein
MLPLLVAPASLLSLQKWSVVVLSVYGDESSDETSSRVFAVAALFGSDQQWDGLIEKWCSRTGGKVFHATECDTDQGDFAGISHNDNKSLYKDLTQLVCSSNLLGFGCAIDLASHNEFFPDVPKEVPYLRCFRDVILQCMDWAKMAVPREDAIKFTFDSRRESDYNAGVLYDYLRNLPDWKDWEDLTFDEISFASRKTIGVQIADLLARETMKYLDNVVGPVKRPPRRSFIALRECKRFGFDFFMREYFQDFRSRFDDIGERVGMRRDEYFAWLREKGLNDNMSNRHRWIFDLDYRERRAKE